MELDPDSRIAFGWADLGDPDNAELGYVSLPELMAVAVTRPDRLTAVVERDQHWTPRRFGDLQRR